MSSKELKQRWAADGGAENAIKNIVCHLDYFLTENQKAAINWHPEQNAALAVMRVLDLLSDHNEELRTFVLTCNRLRNASTNGFYAFIDEFVKELSRRRDVMCVCSHSDVDHSPYFGGCAVKDKDGFSCPCNWKGPE